MLILYSILVLMASFLAALYDHRRIMSKDKDLNHSPRLLIRLCFISVIAALAAPLGWITTVYFLYFTAVFFIPFDVFLNKLRGLPYWYLGQGAVYDRMWLWLISNKKWAGIWAIATECTILILAYLSLDNSILLQLP